MMELQLIIFLAAMMAISIWMTVWNHKMRKNQELLLLGVVPIKESNPDQNQAIAVFLPLSISKSVMVQNNLLVIESEHIRQVDRYDLRRLDESSVRPHYLIEAFSLTD